MVCESCVMELEVGEVIGEFGIVVWFDFEIYCVMLIEGVVMGEK